MTWLIGLTTRVADAEAVLDALGIERAHYLGYSWDVRLGFAVGEHVPERFLPLVLRGNQPYESGQPAYAGPAARSLHGVAIPSTVRDPSSGCKT